MGFDSEYENNSVIYMILQKQFKVCLYKHRASELGQHSNGCIHLRMYYFNMQDYSVEVAGKTVNFLPMARLVRL